MQLKGVLDALEDLAPLRYAESWDNVGLLVGANASDVSRVLVTVDYTDAVADEARRQRANLVVAYHPPIFAAVKRVSSDAPWVQAIRDGIALYSPHTALDVARGGTNDFLADACGIAEEGRAPLRTFAPTDPSFKLVTFVPETDVERVSAALFEAGAGRIGAYTRCSFRSSGTGTFFGDESTSPAVGERGKLERVDEIRLETIVSVGRVERVVGALRASHSYEEPAFDLVRLAASPEGVGQGRVGSVAAESRRAIVTRVKAALGLEHVLVAGPLDAPASRVAVAAGAGGDLLEAAMQAGADVLVTGEIRHHDVLAALRRGLTIVATLHSNSERAAVRAFAERLGERLSGVDVRTSVVDGEPLSFC